MERDTGNKVCTRQTWDTVFFDIAEALARRSRDPSTKVGAVITKDNIVISMGYNGFPRKLRDDQALYKHRETKYIRTIHAEANAILFANRDLTGATIYTTPLMPCSTCALLIIQSGITRVVYRMPKTSPTVDKETSLNLFKEAGVQVHEY